MHMRSENVIGAFSLRVVDVIRSSAEAESGLSGGGPAALVVVVAEPGVGLGDLAKALRLSQPGTSRLVDRLEDSGWIERRSTGGSRIGLHATAKGVEVALRLHDVREHALKSLLSAADPADIEVLAAAADRMLTALTKDEEQLRSTCRLCDRSVCEPCPAWSALADTSP